MPALPDSEEVRKTVIGLARDLRGIGFAFNTKISYMIPVSGVSRTRCAVSGTYRHYQITDIKYYRDTNY